MRLIHTADWQIGKAFASLPAEAATALKARRVGVVHDIGRLAMREGVDAVVVAGDVFEHNTVDEAYLRKTMDALDAYPVPWVLLPGNHDPAQPGSVWNRLQRAQLVPNHVILALTPAPLELAGGRMVILPAPLTRGQDSRDPTAWFDAAESRPGARRVGLAHGSVTQLLPAEHRRIHPIDAGRARSARLDYLALGDWHSTMSVDARTWYAGTPEQDRFHGRDAGNVLLVDLADGARATVTPHAIGYYSWSDLEQDLGSEQSIRALEARLSALGEPARQVVSLRLSGGLPARGRLELDEVIARWQARLRVLRVHSEALGVSFEREDVDDLPPNGVIRATAEALLRIQGDPEQGERADAERALLILLREYHQLEGGTDAR